MVDAISYVLRPIVPRESVGDWGFGPHEANVVDMEMQYADVLPPTRCSPKSAKPCES